MKAGRSRIHLSQVWLIKIAADIENGATTLLDACKDAEVIIEDKNGFPHIQKRIVSPGTVKRELKEIGIELNMRPGRRHTLHLTQMEDIILQEHERSKMGATKVYEQIVAQSEGNTLYQNITHSMVYKTFLKHKILKFTKSPEKPLKVRCRYEANNPNLIWHTDLHNFDGQYLIAFIDDYSRVVVHYEVIPTKESAITKTVLEIAVQFNNRPFCIWTDNGTEFKGDFKIFCEENGIKIALTEVANPQQNGKCERFWKTADLCKNVEELRRWVQEYNNVPHFGLPQITVAGRKTHMSPIQRFNQGVKWNLTIPPKWTVDGETKDFIPFDK